MDFTCHHILLFPYTGYVMWEVHAEYIAVMENTQEIQLINLVGRNNF